MTFYIIEDNSIYSSSPIVATCTEDQAKKVNKESFANKGTIREVTEAELVVEGFDPEQVRTENGW